MSMPLADDFTKNGADSDLDDLDKIIRSASVKVSKTKSNPILIFFTKALLTFPVYKC